MHYPSFDSRQNMICKSWDIFNVNTVLYAFGAKCWVIRENCNRVVYILILYKNETVSSRSSHLRCEHMIPVNGTVRIAAKGLSSEHIVMCKREVQIRSRKRWGWIWSQRKGRVCLNKEEVEPLVGRRSIMQTWGSLADLQTANRAAWLRWKIWAQSRTWWGWNGRLWPNCEGT